LIEAGHDDESLSRNNDGETPLMFAAAAGREEAGVMLAKRFPECIPWANKAGLDAVQSPNNLLSNPH
jgi:ankyrin repeat protein